MLMEKFLSERKALTREEAEAIDSSVLHFLQKIDLNAVGYLHCFLSIPGKQEINTWPIIEWLRACYPQIKVAVPKINDLTFESVVLNEKTAIRLSKWMIPEPVGGKHIETSLFDMVLVPLVIADSTGHRVGYGKGYYDRFLAECKPECKKIGLSAFEPVEPIEDVENHDVRLDALISPTGITWFSHDHSR